MGHTLLSVLLLPMLNTLLYYGHAQDAVLTTDPNWSTFFIGESVTFICDMREGKDADWEYRIKKDGQEYVANNTRQRYTLGPLTAGHSGEYQCVGSRKSSQYTKNSNTVSLTVSAPPKATLTTGPTTISIGASVTLTCSVQSSVSWKYQFLRVTQKNADIVLNPVEANDEQSSVASVSQGGIYQCRGGRGNPVFYTYPSDEVTIRIIFSNEAVLTSSWPEVFSSERVTLTCEILGGENTKWVYEWNGTKSYIHWTYNNYYFFSVSKSGNRDYMCRGRRRENLYSLTEWSKAISLSVSRKPKALLNADIRDIPVGGSVTLSCSVDRSSGWEYFWYRDNNSSEPLSKKDAAFRSNGQISVSQGGLYWCRGGRGDPVYYTEYSEPVEIRKKEPKVVLALPPSWLVPGSSVILNCTVQHPSAGWKFFWYKAVPKVSDNSYSYELLPGSASGTEQNFYSIHGQTHTVGYACRAGKGDPVYYTGYSEPIFVWSGGCAPQSSSLTIALVCGFFLIVTLLALLVCYCRKDLHCGRLTQSLNINRGSAMNQTESQNETQVYSSLLHGDASVYESIRGSGKTESDEPDNDYSNATPLHQTEGCEDQSMKGSVPSTKQETLEQ